MAPIFIFLVYMLADEPKRNLLQQSMCGIQDSLRAKTEIAGLACAQIYFYQERAHQLENEHMKRLSLSRFDSGHSVPSAAFSIFQRENFDE